MTAQGGLMANLGNPQETIAVLQRYGFNFQKKYGQNFLIDTHVLDKIIGAADIQHAATKVTDMDSFSSRVRLSFCSPNELTHTISEHFHRLHFLLLPL